MKVILNRTRQIIPSNERIEFLRNKTQTISNVRSQSVNEYKKVFSVKYLKDTYGRRFLAVGLKETILVIGYPSGSVKSVVVGYYKNDIANLLPLHIEHFRAKKTDILVAHSSNGEVYVIRGLFRKREVIYTVDGSPTIGRKGKVGLKCFVKLTERSFFRLGFHTQILFGFPFDLPYSESKIENKLKENVYNVQTKIDGFLLTLVKCLYFWKEKGLIMLAYNNVTYNSNNNNNKYNNTIVTTTGQVLFFTPNPEIYQEKNSSKTLPNYKLIETDNEYSRKFETQGTLYGVKGRKNENEDFLFTISRIPSSTQSELIVWNFKSGEKIRSTRTPDTCYQFLIFNEFLITGCRSGEVCVYNYFDSVSSNRFESEDEDNNDKKIRMLKSKKFHDGVIFDLCWIESKEGQEQGSIFASVGADGSFNFIRTNLNYGYNDIQERMDFIQECDEEILGFQPFRIKFINFQSISAVSKVYLLLGL